MIGRVRRRLARLLAGSAPIGDQELWGKVDNFICDRLGLQDPVTEAALGVCEAADLPPIAVSPSQGKLLEILVRLHGAKRILELGTLGAYSTIWLARALPPDGRLVTIESDPHCAEVARTNIANAGLADVVQLRVGLALQTLPELAAAGELFDLIFIDADKENYPSYLEWALKLSRPGTLIVADNVVGGGAIVGMEANNPWSAAGEQGVGAVRRLYDDLGANPHIDATVVQTVGDRGYDGFALALVTSPVSD
jgi:predicted O-methyltransferase YrrM